MSPLLKTSSQRRILLVLDDATYASLDGKQFAGLEANHDLQVVSLHDLHRATDDPVAQRLVEGSPLVPGSLLAQNPIRTDEYVDMADAEKSFTLDKAYVLTLLCQYLGAQSVTLKQAFRLSGSRSRKGEGGAKAGPVKGSVKVVGDQEQLKQDLVSVTSRFEGSHPDLEAARQLLQTHHLMSDNSLATLVRMVEHASNPVKERTVKLSMTQELTRSLETLAEFEHQVLPNKVSARYSSLIKERREIEAEYTITF